MSAPIVDCQPQLDYLVSLMEVPKTAIAHSGYAPATDDEEPDRNILAKGSAAKNGDKFDALCNGNWRGLGYPSQSEGDQALVNILAFYSPNDAQVRRLFRASKLGQRDKAGRDDYVNGMIRKARSTSQSVAAQSPATSPFSPAPFSHTAPAFPFVRADRLAATAFCRDHLIQDVLPADALAALIGETGSAKTWCAIGALLAIASGQPWAGKATKRGVVILICGEGLANVPIRVKASAIEAGQSIEELPFYVSMQNASLIDRANLEAVIAGIKAILAEHGHDSVAVICIDTFSRNFGDGDENSARDMATFIRHCDELRTTFGATILIVHHSGHMEKGRARGSSVLRAALDAEYLITKDGDHVVMTTTKAKDWAPHPPIDFSLVPVTVPGADGEQLSSCVLRPWPNGRVLADGILQAEQARMSEQQRKAIELLQQMQAEKISCAPAETDPRVLGVNLDEWRNVLRNHGLEFNRKRWPELLQRLGDRRLIRVEGSHVFPV